MNITDEELNAKVNRQRQRTEANREATENDDEDRKTPDEKLLCALAQPSWAYYDSRRNVAKEDARGTAKSLRELKQERDAEEDRRNNRGRNGEQGRSSVMGFWIELCPCALRNKN